MSIANYQFTRGYILSFRDVVLLEAEVGVHPGHREKAGRGHISLSGLPGDFKCFGMIRVPSLRARKLLPMRHGK